MKYILVKKANYEYIESNYSLVDVFDSKEEAEVRVEDEVNGNTPLRTWLERIGYKFPVDIEVKEYDGDILR